nr:hypothetical protein [uncultured Allomuricauda sp.]
MNHIDIKIGGEKRTLRFGIKVIGDCIKHENNDPQAFMVSLVKNPFASLPLLFYYGLKYHVEDNGGTPDFDLFKVIEWLEEEGLQTEQTDEVTRRFMRSLYENVPTIKELIDGQDEEVKKNLIGTGT